MTDIKIWTSANNKWLCDSMESCPVALLDVNDYANLTSCRILQILAINPFPGIFKHFI